MKNLKTFLKVTGYYLVFCAIWANWSIGPLLNGNAQEFQAAGSIIVVWAILFISRERIRYEKYVRQADRNAMIAAINRLEAHRDLNEKRLTCTFNMHMLQIARISNFLKVPNPHFGFSEEELRKTEKDMEKQIEENSQGITLAEDEALKESIKSLNETKTMIEPWSKYVWIAELGFLVIGTLQWGYGDKFARLAHPIIRSYFSQP